MSDNLIMAMIGASASFLTAFTALILNHRGFGMLEDRLHGIESRIGVLESRVSVVESDLKDFFKHAYSDISRLKERTGLN
ncbi:MAG TPA: hypothetical protein VH325_02820 [Bryobacteraceae bacterium]|jgi:hypothetical protein|nr:hypothetical protein [Bryobacteraceae bacterium]